VVTGGLQQNDGSIWGLTISNAFYLGDEGYAMLLKGLAELNLPMYVNIADIKRSNSSTNELKALANSILSRKENRIGKIQFD
jgi:hypothetical protein